MLELRQHFGLGVFSVLIILCAYVYSRLMEKSSKKHYKVDLFWNTPILAVGLWSIIELFYWSWYLFFYLK
jgi:hypothetical protein